MSGLFYGKNTKINGSKGEIMLNMKKTCYVLSPNGEIGSTPNMIVEKKIKFVIKPVFDELNYQLKLDDSASKAQYTSSEKIKEIIEADLVVADTSTDNPKIFYELALRNFILKPVILIKRPEQVLPFKSEDVPSISIDINDIHTWEKTKMGLKNLVKEIEEDPKTISNSFLPIQAFTEILGRKDIEKEILEIVIDLKLDVEKLKEALLKEKTNFEEKTIRDDSKLLELSKLFKG